MKFSSTFFFKSCLLPLLVLYQFSFGVVLTLRGDENTRVFYNVKSQIELRCFSDELENVSLDEIEWFKGQTNVKEVNTLKERYTITTSTDKKESKFTISKALNNDAGEYSCNLKDQKVEYDVIANLAVKLPANSGVVEGEKLKLYCQSVGTKIQIRWIFPNSTRIGEDVEQSDNR